MHPAAAGAQASVVLAEAGFDPSRHNLTSIFSRRNTIELKDGQTLTALSSQTQWAGGAPLSMLLLSSARPDLVLHAAQVSLLSWLLRGQVVVCTAMLSAEFVAACLHAGARAVVCHASGCTGNIEGKVQDSCAFFAVFYEVLLGGSSIASALRLAEEQCPTLAGSFLLYS